MLAATALALGLVPGRSEAAGVTSTKVQGDALGVAELEGKPGEAGALLVFSANQ